MNKQYEKEYHRLVIEYNKKEYHKFITKCMITVLCLVVGLIATIIIFSR
jgi:succinate dehydrogenase hydrophobic anchor subunit